MSLESFLVYFRLLDTPVLSSDFRVYLQVQSRCNWSMYWSNSNWIVQLGIDWLDNSNAPAKDIQPARPLVHRYSLPSPLQQIRNID